MATLHLTRGIPGSGKSTFAKNWVQEDPEGRVRINRDDLRGMMFATNSKLLSPEQERQVSVIEKSAARAALNAGKDVIIDATNIRSRYVREWFTLGVPVRFHDFPVELHIALERNAGREHPIPREAIEKMFARATLNGALPPAPVSGEVPIRRYEPDWTLPSAFIYDVDGTLAHHSGRSPYDWSRVGEDMVDESVRALLQATEAGHHIIIVSGRDGSCRSLTDKWLSDNFIRYDELYMRAEGDNRRDTVVKREIFDRHIRDRFNVLGVIDDRNSVVRMWRQLGVKCFQAQEGDF